jgi:hypothetical protein
VNEEAMAHWGLSHQKQTNKQEDNECKEVVPDHSQVVPDHGLDEVKTWKFLLKVCQI